jgi:hypothetical protein
MPPWRCRFRGRACAAARPSRDRHALPGFRVPAPALSDWPFSRTPSSAWWCSACRSPFSPGGCGARSCARHSCACFPPGWPRRCPRVRGGRRVRWSRSQAGPRSTGGAPWRARSGGVGCLQCAARLARQARDGAGIRGGRSHGGAGVGGSRVRCPRPAGKNPDGPEWSAASMAAGYQREMDEGEESVEGEEGACHGEQQAEAEDRAGARENGHGGHHDGDL